MASFDDDAVELHPARRTDARVIVSCEHASERIPEPWWLPEDDAWMIGTHWASDLGAADLARSLAEAFGATAVLSRFTRLLADPNRAEDSPELFLQTAEGRSVRLNHAIDQAEKERRLERLFRPYHRVLDREVGQSPAGVLLAVHTFTPIYHGVSRAVELGVLYDREEELAERVRVALDATGLAVRMNEPYSGRAGLMYSAERHAQKYGKRALELELRQDLAIIPEVRARVTQVLAGLFDTDH